jgi:hypothetical protein
MFDIAQEYKQVRVCRINRFQQMFKPISASAPEMQTVCGKICLNTKMEVRDNHQSLFTFNHQCRAITKKFQVHKGLTNPF